MANPRRIKESTPGRRTRVVVLSRARRSRPSAHVVFVAFARPHRPRRSRRRASRGATAVRRTRRSTTHAPLPPRRWLRRRRRSTRRAPVRRAPDREAAVLRVTASRGHARQPCPTTPLRPTRRPAPTVRRTRTTPPAGRGRRCATGPGSGDSCWKGRYNSGFAGACTVRSGQVRSRQDRAADVSLRCAHDPRCRREVSRGPGRIAVIYRRS